MNNRIYWLCILSIPILVATLVAAWAVTYQDTVTKKSGQCGSVPAEAAAAGFTTMALCNDFTQPIPNTAGTGLPSDWLGAVPPSSCGTADQNDHVWWQPGPAWLFCAPPASEDPTGAGGIKQVIDPTYGNRALLLGFSRSLDSNDYRFQGMETMSQDLNHWHDYPQASLIQITFRDDTSQKNSSTNFDFWGYARCQLACSNPGTNNQTFEYDVFEDWAPHWNGSSFDIWEGGSTVHWWNPNNFGEAVYVWPHANNSFWDSYHTAGLLITTDGHTDIRACAFIDHVLQNCVVVPGAPNYCNSAGSSCFSGDGLAGGYGQRNVLTMWEGNYTWFGSGACTSDPNTCSSTDAHVWIKSIQVWSCANWANVNEQCNGNTLVNNQYYRP
jgi:hypothetical protein